MLPIRMAGRSLVMMGTDERDLNAGIDRILVGTWIILGSAVAQWQSA